MKQITSTLFGLLFLLSAVPIWSQDQCGVEIERQRVDGGIKLIASIKPNPNNQVEIAWSTGETGRFIIVKDAGEYCVKIGFRNGCTASDCIEIENDANCYVEIRSSETATGKTELKAVIKPEDADAKFFWSTGEETQSILVEEPGKYCVEIGFSNGCEARACKELGLEPECRVKIQRVKLEDGVTALKAALSPNSEFATFKWNTGDTTQIIRITDVEEYCVRVEFRSGCVAEDCIDLNHNENCSVKIHRIKLDNGEYALQAKPRPANKDVSFKWSTGDTTSIIRIGDTSDYCVRVEFRTGCVAEDCIDLEERDDCKVEIHRFVNDSGQVALIAKIKPDADASFKWNTGDTTQIIRLGDLEEYCVRVEFRNGCVDEDCINIREMDDCKVEIHRVVDDEGNFALKAKIRPDGDASFKWNTGDTTQTIRLGDLDEYCVRVEFREGCVAEDCIEMKPNDNCSVKIHRIKLDNGEIALQAKTRPANREVTYKWNTGDTTGIIPLGDLEEYCVRVEFINGCVAEDCIEIEDEEECKVEIHRIQLDDGTIALQAKTRPEGDVKLVWNTGDTTPIIRLGDLNEYCVKAEFENGCTDGDCIKVRNSDGCKVKIQRVVLDDGTFALKAVWRPEDGQPKIFWSTGDTTQVIRITDDEEFCVKVEFANGCTADDCIKVKNTDRCHVRIARSKTDDGLLLTAKIKPENAVVRIKWNTGDTTESILVTEPGTYCVEVFFVGNECIAEKCVKINGLHDINQLSTNSHEVSASNDLKSNDPSADQFKSPDKTAQIQLAPNPTLAELNYTLPLTTPGNYTVFIEDLGGVVKYSEVRARHGEQANGRILVANLPSGVYLLRIVTETQIKVKKFIKQ